MIGKVSIGKSFGGCVRYVMEKDNAQVLDQSGVRSQSAVMATRDFNAIRRENPDVKNAVMHTSISFAHQDKVSDDMMVNIGKDYLEKMDLQDRQYLMVRHRDTKHEHMHIVINRVGYDGEVASDRWCKNRTARACDQLEVKYGLTIARQQNKVKDIAMDKIPIKKRIKSQIKSEIEKSLHKGINNMNQLKSELSKNKISMKVQTQSTGRINGLSFEKDGLAFKGSSISKDFSYGRLNKQLERNKTRNRGLSL